MSSIDGIGQSLFQYIQSAKRTPQHVDDTAPVMESDPDGGQQAEAPSYAAADTTPFGAALLLTLQRYGIDAQRFQDDFMSALRTVAAKRAGAESSSPEADEPVHINAVG